MATETNSVLPWYFTSRTIAGALVVVVATLAKPVLGIELDDPSQKALLDNVLTLMTLAGAVYVAYGRKQTQAKLDAALAKKE